MVKNPAANAGIWVQSLVQEDSTCCKASKPQFSSCTTATEPERPTARALQQEVTAVRSQHHN